MAIIKNFLSELLHFGMREAIARCLYRIAFKLSGATELNISYPDDDLDHMIGIGLA